MKGSDFEIAANPFSAPGEAKKARDWGILIISIEEFLIRTSSST